MQRGEKRGLPLDGSPSAASAAAPGPPIKKAREKMPDFDWSAENYKLTWALVNELKRPENRAVLFPDQENIPIKSGDTKEDAYRRIAKVVHSEAYNHDAQTSGSRMKNKTVAMWKEYSGYCRKLQELSSAHGIILPVTGPDEGHPQELLQEWRRINNSMPVFQVLRTFMPIRQEDKPKTPAKMQLLARGSSSAVSNPFDEDLDQESQRSQNSPGVGGAVQPLSSPAAQTPSVRDQPNSALEGRHQVNGHHSPHSFLCTSEYLDLRRSYQEDVRLGIFSPAEAKAHIERLDAQFKRLDRSPSQLKNSRALPPPPPSSSSVTASTPLQTPSHMSSPLQDPHAEHHFTERARQLGFIRPSQLPALSRLPAKDFFKVLIDHAAICPLDECRLDPGRRVPHLGISYTHQSFDPIDVFIAGRTGPTPLLNHPTAACATFVQSISAPNGAVKIMDIFLPVHTAPSWPTTLWDFTQTVISHAMRTPLSVDDIKNIQAKAYAMSPDPNFRQRFQSLKDPSTVYDVLRIGYLLGNDWILGSVPAGMGDGFRDRQIIQN